MTFYSLIYFWPKGKSFSLSKFTNLLTPIARPSQGCLFWREPRCTLFPSLSSSSSKFGCYLKIWIDNVKEFFSFPVLGRKAYFHIPSLPDKLLLPGSPFRSYTKPNASYTLI